MAIEITPVPGTFKFIEVAGNNGAIANSLTLKITGGTFAGDNGDLVGATISNVPAGLTAVLVKTSATTAKLSFTGTATAHAITENVTDLTVTFASGNFATGGTAPAAITDLAINFKDPAAEKTLALVAPTGAGTSETYKAANLPTITGTAPDGVTKVYIYNNGGTKSIGEAAVTGNAWTFTLPAAKLKDGAYNLTASASNDGKGAMTAGFAFTVDQKAPAAPSVNAVKGAISDVTPVLSGKAEKGATVKVYSTETQGDDTFLGETTADAKGLWTLAVTDATKLAADGNYKISALAIDAAGNETKSKVLTKDNLTIDTTIATPTLVLGTAKGNSLALSGTVAGEAGGTLQLYGGEDGSLALGKVIKIDKTGAWKSSIKLTDGKHLLSVVATDAAGNVSDNSTLLDKTIDTFTATPTLELVEVDGVLTGLKGTAEAGATLKITIGGEKDKFTDVPVGTDGTWTQSLVGFSPAKLGKLKITAIATDTASNVSKASTAVEHTFAAVVADVVAPTFVSATTNAAGDKIILTYSEKLHATTAAAEAFAVDVDGSSNVVTEVAISEKTVTLSLTTPITPSQSVKVGYSAPEAVAAATNAAIQDTAGNDAATLAATTAVTNIAVDTTAPTINAFTVASATTLSVTSNEAGTAALYSETIVGSGTFDKLIGTAINLTASNPGTITVAADTTQTVAQLKVFDAAGNFASSLIPVVIGTTGADAITLTGTSSYVFAFAGADTITLNNIPATAHVFADYVVIDDSIKLSKAAFTGFTTAATLTTGQFLTSTSAVAATTATQRLIYNSSTGDLRYDADGSTATVAPVLIGTFTTKPALVFGEFASIA